MRGKSAHGHGSETEREEMEREEMERDEVGEGKRERERGGERKRGRERGREYSMTSFFRAKKSISNLLSTDSTNIRILVLILLFFRDRETDRQTERKTKS